MAWGLWEYSIFGTQYDIRPLESFQQRNSCVCVCMCVLWPHLGRMEIPRPGIKSELPLQASLQPQQQRIQVASAAYTTGCGNARFLTH